jgi:hypothetical protein
VCEHHTGEFAVNLAKVAGSSVKWRKDEEFRNRCKMEER